MPFSNSDDLALLDAIQTSVLLLDRGGHIRAINRAAEAVVSRDAIGAPFSTFFAAGRMPQSTFDSARLEGRTVRTTATTPTGALRTTEWSFTPRDEHIVATGIDVTSEERQRAIVDFGFSALTEHDLRALLSEACAIVRQACGYDGVAVLRHVPDEGFSVTAMTEPLQECPIIPDDPKNLAGFVFRADGPVIFDDLEQETRFQAPHTLQSGFLSGVATVINGAYAPYGFLYAVSRRKNAFSDRDALLVQSIAAYLSAAMARRAAEDESHRMRRDYAQLIEIAQEGVILLDPSGHVTFANAKAAAMFDRRANDLIGHFYLDGISPDDRADVRREFEELLRGTIMSRDARLVRCDDSMAWASIAASPMLGERGEVTAVLAVISDITARVRAEQELRRREAQLREAQSIAHMGSFEFDLGADEVSWSDEMYRIAGLAPQSTPITHEVFSTFMPQSARRRMDENLASLDAGNSIDVKQEFLPVHGPPRFVHAKARIVTDQITGRKRVVGSVQDITDERAARLELLEREARLRLLISQLPVIMWSTDLELTITSILGAGMKAYLAANELRLHVSHLIGGPRSDADSAEALQGRAVTFEMEHEGRNLRVHIEPLRDPSSDVVGTLGFAFDVTEQKRSERTHRELLEVVRRTAREWTETFDSIASPVILLDDNLCVSRLNSSALALSECETYVDAVGRPATELGRSALWNEIAAAAASSRQSGAPVAVRITSDDDRRWDVVASPWSNSERTTIVASDVTAIARMQEHLQRSERMSAVGGLVAGVAHEVRNPLFGISATLDAFEARFGDEQFRTYTAALREQLDRMNELMHDLLEFGRPAPIVLLPGSIGAVIASAQSSVRALAARENVTIAVDAPPNLPEIAMSTQRLLQVLENLAENAIQHSPRGGTVSIRAWHDPVEHSVVVAVEDCGPGFRPEDFGRIFEPFFTRRSGGTGLGLSLVQRIVDDHNGSISARNHDSGGASVMVSLPCL